MDYDEKIRHPGEPITSGAEMFKHFGYTDVRNPIYSFDLMNDSKFEYLKDCIDNEKEIPERYNNNIIRLRDYRLGGMINDFIAWCESELYRYEEAWTEYRKEYNPSMPDEFYEFWYLSETIILDEILPKFINLIDPVSMCWIDPEYPKVKIDKGTYNFQINKPILTADPTFLYPGTKVKYESHEPDYESIATIHEELSEEVSEYLPVWMLRVESLNNSLQYKEPKNGKTEDEMIKRIKWETRRAIRYAK